MVPKIFRQMFNKGARDGAEDFVELPTGIFTSSGIWFHTSENYLREFANEVIDRVGFGNILKQAATWVNSQEAVCAICFLGFLFVMDPLAAMALALVVYFVWFVWSPLLVVPGLSKAVAFCSSSLLQGALFVVGLSVLGRDGQIPAVGVGLLGFFLIRWGIIKWIVVTGLSRTNSAVLPREDRILRTLLVRHAVSMGITLPSLESFENRIREIWLRGKQH